MKNLIRIEEGLMLALAAYLNTYLPYPGWLFWALFLTPDIGFVGYAFNPRAGAFTYNLLHHKGVAIALYFAGLLLSSTLLQFIGLLLFGHSSFDRMLGYGLKYPDSFHNTHLGMIGKKQE
ncbi:MAG: DUF4260 domain-containing protein [Chryseosolibacter sp.]